MRYDSKWLLLTLVHSLTLYLSLSLSLSILLLHPLLFLLTPITDLTYEILAPFYYKAMPTRHMTPVWMSNHNGKDVLSVSVTLYGHSGRMTTRGREQDHTVLRPTLHSFSALSQRFAVGSTIARRSGGHDNVWGSALHSGIVRQRLYVLMYRRIEEERSNMEGA